MTESKYRVDRNNDTIREKTAQSIRDAILTNHFSAGQRLVERELCDLTGVSRTSVREALRQLEAEGLVEIKPNRGPFVTCLDPKTTRDIYELREALESMAAKLFLQRASPDLTMGLISALETSIEASRSQNTEAMLTTSEKFSDLLIEGSENSIIIPLYQNLRTRLSHLRSKAISALSDEDRKQTIAHLEAIAVALKNRDPDAASQACSLRMQHAANQAVRIIETEQNTE